jgi:drug/metabolite transporter (DMT)-like permease
MNSIIITVLFTLAMTIAGSIGAYSFKKVTMVFRRPFVVNLLKSKRLYFGSFLYVAASVFNVILLRTLDYSVVYPLTALTYVWTIIIAWLLLKEPLNRFKIIAIILIGTGIILITR